MDPVATSDVLAAIPPDIAHTMLSTTVIAGAIRGFTGLLKTPLLAGVWMKLPWWAKPCVLLLLTTVAAFCDALTGQVWYLALGAALTGLGGAVVSYEWQQLFKDAQAAAPATPPKV